ncbi:MAG TPA: hypothetical protein PKA64_07065 [Myxococcota bacterium]|nr:hypothetical protein [Myxococcota bacterium]
MDDGVGGGGGISRDASALTIADCDGSGTDNPGGSTAECDSFCTWEQDYDDSAVCDMRDVCASSTTAGTFYATLNSTTAATGDYVAWGTCGNLSFCCLIQDDATTPELDKLGLHGWDGDDHLSFRYDTNTYLAPVKSNDNINGYLWGDAGDDSLTGSESNRADDVIDGGSGTDVIACWGGEDIVSGGAGGDFISGGLGVDVLNGNGGDDFIGGGDAGDIIDGEDGEDFLCGGDLSSLTSSATCEIATNDFGDTIHGGDDDDQVDGGDGDDFLYGDAGMDVLRSGDGSDELSGGGEGDLLCATQSTNPGMMDQKVLQGGAGNDQMQFSSAYSMTVTMIGGDGTDGCDPQQSCESSFTSSCTP